MNANFKLDELGRKYKTDKSSLLHNYLVSYEPFFVGRDRFKKVVEIGLQRGKEWRDEKKLLPSMRMWAEYFPNAYLYGFDIKKFEPINDRMTLYCGDQGNLNHLKIFSEMVGGNADFIIDDGSHKSGHQLATFAVMFNKLRPGGIYIIEDMNPVVQKNYPEDCRIHNLIEPFLAGETYHWVSSKSAGPKSSLVIIKK